MEMDGVKGVKGIRQLNYKLVFIATNVIVENNQFRETEDNDFDEVVQENQQKEYFDEDQIRKKILGKL